MTLEIGFLHSVWCAVSVDLMRAFAIVKLYICPDTFSEFSLGTVVVAIKLFCFEGFEKCLHHGVVVGHTFRESDFVIPYALQQSMKVRAV